MSARLATSIAAAMRAAGVETLTELQTRSGLAYSTVHRACRGGAVTLHTIEAIARALETTPAALLTGGHHVE